MMFPIFNTYISPNAIHKIKEVLDTKHLSEGTVSKEFEEALSLTFGFSNLICLNSGTSSLHLALDLLDLQKGDEVILPAQTFVATGLAVLYCKATPVFADINYVNGNINTESVRSKITSKTRAILCVHWGGYPCDLNELKELVHNTNIKLIEDSAHALGAKYNNQVIGSISDMSCFSFQAIKHLSTGDGGAICIKDNELYRRALKKKWFGIDRLNSTTSELGERVYDLDEIGFKYHLNNFCSALGLANLEGYFDRLNHRIEIASWYRSELAKISGIHLFEEKNDRQSAYWLFGMHVEKRLEFIRALKSSGIAASVVHQRIDRNSVFGGITKGLIGQEEFDKTQIHIPIHDGISLEDAKFITDIIKKGW
jgi:perosamine synthetase